MFRKSIGGWLVAVLTAAVLAGCGGGTQPVGGGPGSAATGVTRGVISSSSALTVNGVTFDASTAKISVDGVADQSSAELRKGRVVTVRGTFDDRTGKATEIEISSACEGMVSHKSGPELDVGGQVVKADGQTEFEDNGRGLDSIAEGERVEVHGFPDDSGAIRATRIEKRSGTSDDFEVKGFVANLNAAAVPPTFDLKITPAAPATFKVTLAAGVSLPAGLQNGSAVEVKSAAQASPTGEITASALRLEDAKLGEANLKGEVEGLVTAGNAGAFQVGSQAVVTTAATVFAHGTAADVIPGARVEAEGTLDAQGVLQASKVSFETTIRLQAVPSQVTAIDAHTGTLVLLGITVHTDTLTEFKDFSGQAVDLQQLGSHAVAVRGSLHRNGTDVVATRLELTDDQRLELRGPVSAKDAASHNLTILGVRVDTASAEFSGTGPSTEASFFSSLKLGDIVGIRGKDARAWSGSVLTADEVELEGD